MTTIINRIKKQINELKSLSTLNKSQEKELAILENILQELESIKDTNSELTSKINFLETNNKTLINNIQELNRNNSKGIKVRIYEFITGLVTNLFSFTLIKFILKRTVPVYLEKLISYVFMGVIINNIFGNYLNFIYGIIYELIDQSTSTKAILSFLGITSIGEWINLFFQHFKDFFTNLRRDSTSVNLEKFNKEFDKQLEIDKLNRSNEILVDKLDELTRKVEVQERITLLREEINKESRSWTEFSKEIAKDWGIQVYNSIKFIVITSLITYTGKYLFTNYFNNFFSTNNSQDNLNSLDNQLINLLGRKNNLEIAVKYLEKAREKGELPANLETTVENLKANLSLFDLELQTLEKEYIYITKDRRLTIEDVLKRLDPENKLVLNINEDFSRIAKNSEAYIKLSDILHELKNERSSLDENLHIAKLVHKSSPSEEMKDSISNIINNIKEVNLKISEVEHCKYEVLKSNTISQEKITLFEEFIKNFKVSFDEFNDSETNSELNNELSSSTETIKPNTPRNNPQSIPLPPSPIVNDLSNLPTTNEQSNKEDSLDKILSSNEYNNKAIQYNNNMERVVELTKILNGIHSELKTLDITKDFDRINYLQQEIVKFSNEANHLKIETETLGGNIELDIKKYSK